MVAFPSSNGTRQESVAAAWTRARDLAASVKTRTSALSTAAAAEAISSTAILEYAMLLADVKIRLQSAASVSGIAAYAQNQIADPTFDIVSSFNDMVAAITAVQNWIVTNFPKDGNGFLLAKTFMGDNSGRTQDRTFTPAQTATLRTVLNNLVATID